MNSFLASSKSEEATTAELLARYGITHVSVDRYHYKNYQYSKPSDAIAQAKRDKPTS